MTKVSQVLVAGKYLGTVRGTLSTLCGPAIVYHLQDCSSIVHERWDTVMPETADAAWVEYHERLRSLRDPVTGRMDGVFRFTIENGETGAQITSIEKVMEA